MKELIEIIEDCPMMELTGSDLNYNAVACNAKYPDNCEYSIQGTLLNTEKELPHYCWKHMFLKDSPKNMTEALKDINGAYRE